MAHYHNYLRGGGVSPNLINVLKLPVCFGAFPKYLSKILRNRFKSYSIARDVEKTIFPVYLIHSYYERDAICDAWGKNKIWF